MDIKYKTWIDAKVKELGRWVRGSCQHVSKQMVETFPELIICRGYVYDYRYDSTGFQHIHWWCKDSAGNIIDPTVSQFHFVIERYEEFNVDLHGPEPYGKCMNCGELSYREKSPNVCSDECCKELEYYLNKDRFKYT